MRIICSTSIKMNYRLIRNWKFPSSNLNPEIGYPDTILVVLLTPSTKILEQCLTSKYFQIHNHPTIRRHITYAVDKASVSE
jgi:hypothetical protein